MKSKWESKGIYEHPAKHQAGQFGTVALSEAGVYCLKQGGGIMSCPAGWAAGIHKQELEDDVSALLIRGVPDDLRKKLKHLAVERDISLNALIINILSGYVK
jgi:hypothetical protein